MSRYRFTPEAVDDLFDLWCCIATDDLEAANCALWDGAPAKAA